MSEATGVLEMAIQLSGFDILNQLRSAIAPFCVRRPAARAAVVSPTVTSRLANAACRPVSLAITDLSLETVVTAGCLTLLGRETLASPAITLEAVQRALC